MTAVAHSFYMAQRLLRALFRQPWYIVSTLVQPMIWLLLYGQLFKRIIEIPGFGVDSYMTFLTPGVIVMTALFSGGWSGIGQLYDMRSGALDRFLISPADRTVLIAGRLASLAVLMFIQSLILLIFGWLMGARFPAGLPGVAVLILVAVILCASVGAMSSGLALLIRREESLIAVSNLILLPLTFMSPVFIAKDVMPGWIRTASLVNPVSWSIEAGREALSLHPDQFFIASRVGFLLTFAAVCVLMARYAFRAYQNST